MATNAANLIKDALKEIREAKRPTFWQVTKETIKALPPTVLLALGGLTFFTNDHPVLATITWVITSILLSLQAWVLWTSIKVRRELFKLRDDLVKVHQR
jgi:hypothetical protein